MSDDLVHIHVPRSARPTPGYMAVLQVGDKPLTGVTKAVITIDADHYVEADLTVVAGSVDVALLPEQVTLHTEPVIAHRVDPDAPTGMRRFQLQRTADLSGVSGTGVVAEGVLFSDGRVAVHWLGACPSTVTWDNIGHALRVHGHGGATQLVWLDTEETPS